MTKALLPLSVCLIWSATSFGVNVRVVGDRINLRAGDSLTTEITGQVNHGEILDAVFVGEQWVKVVPPSSVSFWVHSDLVRDGVVTSSKVNVRALPGISSSVVGRLDPGCKVTTRGTFNEWLKIAPPPGCFLWISREFVTLLSPTTEAIVAEAPKLEKKPVSAQPAKPVPAVTGETPSQEKNKLLSELPETLRTKLVADKDQGRVVIASGTLARHMFLWGRPSKLAIVKRGKLGGKKVCYLLGSENQLKPLVGRRVQVCGRQYWKQSCKYPVLIPEQVLFSR